jgi:hypothetical protein
MFDIITHLPGLIAITIVLLILVSIAIWQKLYQAAMVMGGVYIIYILYITISPKDALTIPSTNLNSSVEQEIIIPQIIDDSTNLIPNIDDVGKTVLLLDSVDSNKVMIQTIDSTIGFKKIYKPEIGNPESKISVLSMTVGTGIINRRIENPDSLFSVDTKRIYCLTGIHNQNDSKVIYHKWYQEGRLRSKVKLALERSNLWRTWSYITIKGQKTGNWQIVVEDTSGIRYDSLSFKIVDSVKE